MSCALLALEGLSVGDAFGERFFGLSPLASESRIQERQAPPGRWTYTADTVMALSVVEVLDHHGRIDQDELAEAFGRRYAAEPN